jgi:2'-hydroxyisoflavone reductase
VSSLSVYRDFSQPGLAEDGEVEELPEESEDVRAHYGALKALCERVVEGAFPGRALNVRPGLIVGPHDPTERFTYWVRGLARGGRVLAPGSPDRQIQVIDARDLAEWMVGMVERQASGVYNATGPDYDLTMGAFLEVGRREAGSDAELVWVDDEFLLARDVGEWRELPLWLASADTAGLLSADVSKAIDAGLRFRPISETVRDTLRWAVSNEPGPGTLAMGPAEGVGLAPDREAALLAEWDAR